MCFAAWPCLQWLLYALWEEMQKNPRNPLTLKKERKKQNKQKRDGKPHEACDGTAAEGLAIFHVTLAHNKNEYNRWGIINILSFSLYVCVCVHR
jgi:hypothetical protein